jgi:hypothetical protein
VAAGGEERQAGVEGAGVGEWLLVWAGRPHLHKPSRSTPRRPQSMHHRTPHGTAAQPGRPGAGQGAGAAGGRGAAEQGLNPEALRSLPVVIFEAAGARALAGKAAG